MTSNTPQSSADPLPFPARYLTDNNAEAKSEFSQVLPSPIAVTHEGGKSKMRLAYTIPGLPINLNNQADIKAFEESAKIMKTIPPLIPPGGGSVWYVDHPPGTVVPMHRTLTLDFVTVLSGEVELQMDYGEKKLLRVGDLAIQRATVHGWHNPSKTQWVRLLAITLQSDPVQVGGQTLVEQMPPRPPIDNA